MTLILGLHVNGHAMQVSDRLVSTVTNPPRKYDTMANKTVVYFALRGVVSISYTGRAYLHGIPTDQWIAETLSGRKLSTPGTAFGNCICLPFDVGQAIECLRKGAEDSYKQLSSDAQTYPLELHIIGSQWDRKHGRIRPVVKKVTNRRTGCAAFETLSIPRWIPTPGSRYDLVAGVGTEEARQFMTQKFESTGGMISPQNCIDVMAKAIKFISSRLPNTVGSDCMAVHIQGSSVRVIYLPSEQKFLMNRLTGKQMGPVSFTPYVISRNMAARPSISINNMFMRPQDIDISFEGWPTVPLSVMPAFQLDQPRRRDPSKP